MARQNIADAALPECIIQWQILAARDTEKYFHAQFFQRFADDLGAGHFHVFILGRARARAPTQHP